MASVSRRNKYVVDEQKRLQFEMQRERQLAKADKLAQIELDEERKRMDQELKKLQTTRDKLESETGQVTDEVNLPHLDTHKEPEYLLVFNKAWTY